MSELLKTLEVTVISQTAEDREHFSKKSNLSIGEVIDRLTSRIVSEDPKVAYGLILDDFLLITAKLSQEDVTAVTCDLISALMISFQPEFMDEIVRKTKEDQKEMLEKLSSMTAAEKTELKESVREVFSDIP